MPGRARKAPNALAGHRAKDERELRIVPASVPQPAPSCPRGLLTKTRALWARVWESPQAIYFDRDIDLYRIERWIGYVDERERAWREYKKQRFTTGSTGQLVASPALRSVLQMDARIEAIEDSYGMTLLARARIGLALGQAAEAARRMNEGMDESDEPPVPRPVEALEGEWQAL